MAAHAGQPRRKPSLDFSLAGLLYALMILFMGLAAVNSQANLLFAVLGMMLGVLVVTWFVSRTVLRKLEVRRVLPETAVVGEPAMFLYQFTNRKRRLPSFSVTIADLDAAGAFDRQPQAYLLHAAPGTTATVPVSLTPVRRGVHHLDRYQISTSFPFGFIRRAADRRQKDAVLVHPPVAEVDRRLLVRCVSAEQSGSRMRPRRGGSDEFYGVREFRQGDNPRYICWRRSARTGELVVREMMHVAPPRLVIVLDTFLESRTMQAHALVERTIAMAGSLIRRTLGTGLAVGLVAWADGVQTMPPRRGKRHWRDLMAVLARLPANTAVRCDKLLEHAAGLLRPGTTPILFTPADAAGQRRGDWLVISATDPSTAAMFRFAPTVDFTRCIPADQMPPADVPAAAHAV